MVSLHSSLGLYLLGRLGMNSLMGLPNRTWAGEEPVSLSDMLCWDSKALLKEWLSRLLCGATFSLINLLADYTPSSARWFEWGKYAEEGVMYSPGYQAV